MYGEFKLKSSKIKSLEEFKKLVAEWSKDFTAKSIILLNGQMGAGKTEFVKTFCHNHGVDHVVSPTFAIHHHYENSKISIDHLDLYRIESEDELESTGFWDLFTQSSGVIFIEWSEKMDITQLPADWDILTIDIKVSDDGIREITLKK